MADDTDEQGASTRIEVVGRVLGRRRWTVEQKLAMLRDASGPDGSVSSACEQHESRQRSALPAQKLPLIDRRRLLA